MDQMGVPIALLRRAAGSRVAWRGGELKELVLSN